MATCSLRNVLAKVLAWHLPEHNLEPSGVCGYMFLRNVLAQVLICHLPEHDLKPSGGLWAGRGGPWGTMGPLGRLWGVLGWPLEVSWGPCGVSRGALGGPLERWGVPEAVPEGGWGVLGVPSGRSWWYLGVAGSVVGGGHGRI